MVSAAKIKRARERLNESQATFGARFDVDQSTVHRWETGGPPQRGPAAVLIGRFLKDELEQAVRAAAKVAA